MKVIITQDFRHTVRILNNAKRAFHLTAIDSKIASSSIDPIGEGKSPYEELQALLDKNTEVRLVIYVSPNLRFDPGRVFWEIIVN